MDVEPDRIRILSSLEGRRSRGHTSTARQGRQHTGAGARSAPPTRWWSHVLLGLMGMGLFTVALAVFLIIKSSRDNELPLTRWDIVTPASQDAANDPDTLLSSQPPGAGVLSAEVAEAETFGLLHQETVDTAEVKPPPDADGALIEVVTSTPPQPPVATAASEAAASVAANAQAAAPKVSTPATSTSTAPAPTAAAPLAALTPAAPATPSPSPKPKPAPTMAAASPAATSVSADVRLLEAVFPKHDPRTASKAELFKACQGMTGAESAICRARICVQHPGVPACQ